MPDPHILYVVMAVVTTGLALWVVAANVFAPKIVPAVDPPAPSPPSPEGPKPPPSASAA